MEEMWLKIKVFCVKPKLVPGAVAGVLPALLLLFA
jgi:hypothetical protein